MTLAPAGLFRRLAAMVYDLFLLAAILFLAAVPPVLINGGAITGDGPGGEFKQAAFTIYLAAVAFLFYGGFWTRGGQTLGMAAWRIRIVRPDGEPISWRQAAIRWATACLGLANIGCLFAADRRGWHERLSNSHTVYQARPGHA
jgi:uncharacterized RDD family membrane protein YckC